MLSCYYGNRQGFFLFVTTLLAIGMDAIQMGAFIYFFFFISNLRAKPANWMRRRTTSSRHSIKLLREKTSRTSMEPEKKNVVLIFILFYKLFSIYYTQVETPWKPSPIKSIHLDLFMLSRICFPTSPIESIHPTIGGLGLYS